MSYFIFEGKLELNQAFILKGDEAAHLLQSRRIQPGEWIEIQDVSYQRFQAKVVAVLKKELKLLPISLLNPPADSPYKINLFQALIKDKALDLILQKATELGVASICIFQSSYSQRLKKDVEKQVARWQKICVEACKQSGRVKPPALSFLDSHKELEKFIHSHTKSVPTICLTTSPQSLRLGKIPNFRGAVNLLIGPEGGWQAGECSGPTTIPVNLGQRILRSETAAIATISILQYVFGDLSAEPQ